MPEEAAAVTDLDLIMLYHRSSGKFEITFQRLRTCCFIEVEVVNDDNGDVWRAKSVNCPAFDTYEHVLFLRGSSRHLDNALVHVSRLNVPLLKKLVDEVNGGVTGGFVEV